MSFQKMQQQLGHTLSMPKNRQKNVPKLLNFYCNNLMSAQQSGKSNVAEI
jgi:hypothetical protein